MKSDNSTFRCAALGAALFLSLTGCQETHTASSDAGRDGGAATPDSGAGLPAHDAGHAPLDAGSAADGGSMRDPIVCKQCQTQVDDCVTDPGCVEIHACAIRTGCQGTQCYFAQPMCMAVIDRWGSTSLSTTLAQQLEDCLTRAGGRGLDLTGCPVVPADDAGTSDAGG